MIKLQTGSRFGQFQWTGECEVSQEAANRLAALGLLQIIQRSPSSAAEKLLAGYEKRPDKFKRDSIPFTEDNAESLRKQLSMVTLDADGDLPELKIEVDVAVEQYIANIAESKFTEEKTIVGNHVTKNDLAEWAKAKGLGDVPEKPLEDKEFLAKVREVKKATLAAM